MRVKLSEERVKSSAVDVSSMLTPHCLSSNSLLPAPQRFHLSLTQVIQRVSRASRIIRRLSYTRTYDNLCIMPPQSDLPGPETDITKTSLWPMARPGVLGLQGELLQQQTPVIMAVSDVCWSCDRHSSSSVADTLPHYWQTPFIVYERRFSSSIDADSVPAIRLAFVDVLRSLNCLLRP